ncbi:MAG: hypothetical protein ABF497_08120 [Sporolactobacillus sp.]
MKGKIMEAALTFFLAAVLIYLGTRLLLTIWWVPVLLAVIILAAVIFFRIRRSRRPW